MSTLTSRDLEHVFESLRKGLVPERGIDTFAVGIDKQRRELHRQLGLAEAGEGTIKFLRGGYGCGKTFMARLALLDARERGFATSFVVVSDNDLHFHRFDDVYRKVLSELSTSSCPRAALSDILDRWIGKVEDALISAGADEDADDFDDRVRSRLSEELASMTAGRAPADFVRVVQAIFDLKQQGDFAGAGSLISWLSGSKNVAASAKRSAGVKGEVGSREALSFLRGVLEIVKAAGYRGLVIVIDEAETILRMRGDVRKKSMNGIRQIADASGEYPGLLWIFTGTAEFFDTRRGVAGLPPLHDRISFQSQNGFASVRQPQLELKPFNASRLRSVALRLRTLYPTQFPQRRDSRVSDEFVGDLVAQVTEGFKGDVGVVPRQFLREFVGQIDMVDEDEDYNPTEHYGFQARALTAEERLRMEGGVVPPSDGDDDDDLIPAEDAW